VDHHGCKRGDGGGAASAATHEEVGRAPRCHPLAPVLCNHHGGRLELEDRRLGEEEGLRGAPSLVADVGGDGMGRWSRGDGE
jgi:hypothetical protein